MSVKKLYIGGIPGHLSEGEILRYFLRFVPEATINLNKYLMKNGSNGGSGILSVPKWADVSQLLNRDHYLEGKLIECKEFLGGRGLNEYRHKLKLKRIFVRGLKNHVTDQDLADFFAQFGSIESAYKVKIQSTGRIRSFGYVTFKNEGPAQTLISQGSVLINGVLVYIHRFDRAKEETANPSLTSPTDQSNPQEELNELCQHCMQYQEHNCSITQIPQSLPKTPFSNCCRVCFNPSNSTRMNPSSFPVQSFQSPNFQERLGQSYSLDKNSFDDQVARGPNRVFSNPRAHLLEETTLDNYRSRVEDIPYHSFKPTSSAYHIYLLRSQHSPQHQPDNLAFSLRHNMPRH